MAKLVSSSRSNNPKSEKIMNKKEYIKPIVKHIIINNEALLAASDDPNVVSFSFEGDDGGAGEAEVKGHNRAWDAWN